MNKYIISLVVNINQSYSSKWLADICAVAIAQRSHFFRSYQKNESLSSSSSGRLAIVAERFSNPLNLLMLIGQEKYYLPKTWFSPPLANLKQGSQQRQGLKIQNWAPPLFNGPKFFFTSDESSLFTETFFENCNLNDSCSSLSISFAELNQPQVHNVKATLKMTSKITKTLHSTNTSSHYCILEMVLKICEPEQASAHEACDSTLMLAKDNTTLNFTVYST